MAHIDRLTPISVDEMLLEWAVAERHEWVDPPPALLRKADAGEALDVQDSETAISLFGRVSRRGPEVTFFRRQRAEWFRTDVPIAGLGDAVLHKHWAQSHWAQSAGASQPYPRTVAELARRPDVPPEFGRDGMPDPIGNRRPILVATKLNGPWHVAEGSHRLHAAWRAHVAQDPRFQSTLPVIIGVHPNMSEWSSFLM